MVEREGGASQEVGASSYWMPTMCQTPCPGVSLLCTTSLESRCPSAAKSIHDKVYQKKVISFITNLILLWNFSLTQ